MFIGLNKTGYATEIEIKISAADLRKDKKKGHGHNHNYIKYLYYAVPSSLVDLALDEIPETAGLYEVLGICSVKRGVISQVRMVRQAKARKAAVKWDESERLALARLGSLRILNLKEKVWKKE